MVTEQWKILIKPALERERDRGRRDRRKMALREERSGVRRRENNSVYSCM